MPQIYQTQLEYAPKFTAQDLALQQQFGPQYAQMQWENQQKYGQLYAQQQYDVQSQLAPQYAALEQQLQSQYAPQQAALQLALQQQFAPQYAQLQADIQGQTGAQYAQQNLDIQNQFGGQYAQALREQQGILDPSKIAGQNALAAYLGQEDELTDYEKMKASEDIRAAQASRGMVESGMGASSELEKLTELRQQLKTRRLNLALAASQTNTGTPVIPTTASGSTSAPMSGIQTQQVSTPTTTQPTVANQQYISNVTPSNTFGLASSNYSTGAGLWSNQQQLAQQQAQNSQNFFGDIAGGLISGAGSVLGGMATGGTGFFSSRRYKKNIKLWKTHLN
jgi:hypothetical protein